MFETFLILRSTERHLIKTVYVGLHVKCYFYCQILMKLLFSREIVEISSKKTFNINPSITITTRVVPCGQANTHDESNSPFSQFYEYSLYLTYLNRLAPELHF